MSFPRVLLLLLRIGAVIQVIGGVTLWTRHGYGFLGVHRDIGMLYVAVLWLIAFLAFVAQQAKPLAIAAFVLGAVIVWLGMAQVALLPGDLHWIVRTVHLALGLSAIPIAERLTRIITSAPTVPAA